MGELRKDYFLDEYVIISPERAKRPHDFQQHPQEPAKNTPFTPGNESQLPPIIYEEPKGSNWRIRVIPNKFAITRPEGDADLKTNGLYTWSSNFGHHEIVVEGQKDNVPFSELGPDYINDAIRVAIVRVKTLSERPGVKYVAYFKNERPEAGASISHPHSQIIATSIIPPRISQLTAAFSSRIREYGFSPLYKVLDHERNGERMIIETKHFAAICPYASRFPFEVLIIPIRHSNSYTTMSQEEQKDLAILLHKLLGKLASISAPFNIEWVHSPAKDFHWHITIAPRLNVWAGFEFQTQIIVNPVPPENAANFYKG